MRDALWKVISSRIKSSCMLFDDMHSRLLKLMGDKAVYRPGSINEAKLLLKLSKEFSDSLRSMVFELNKCGGADEKSSITRTIAKMIAYCFFQINEVIYAIFPMLSPIELRDQNGGYKSSCKVAVIKREDLEEIAKMFEAFKNELETMVTSTDDTVMIK